MLGNYAGDPAKGMGQAGEKRVCLVDVARCLRGELHSPVPTLISQLMDVCILQLASASLEGP